MDAVSLVILGLVGFLTLVHLSLTLFQPRGLPPGPRGVPLLGYLPFLDSRTFLTFFQLAKKYGPVVTVRLGMRRIIMLNSYSALKEALVTRGDNFAGRVKGMNIDKRSTNYGIANVDGPLWQEHRRFSLRVLRDFGFGRSLSEDVIQAEVERLRSYLDAKVDQPVNAVNLLLRCVSNVICTITMGEQPGFDDPEFTPVIERLRSNIQTNFLTTPFFGFPFLRHFSFLVYVFPRMRRILGNLNVGHAYIRDKIEKHKKELDPAAEPRDFTDVYLLEQLKREQAGEKHTFTDWQLIRVIFELFIAGTDTTSNSLAWLLLMLSLDKDLQTKVHLEIDEHVGTDRLPMMKDRKEMHLVQACLDEVQRFASIAPNGLFHRNFQEDTVQGFTIPGNSTILPNVYAVHHDSDVWERPEEFYPAHFLDAEGQYKSRDELVPFLIGRRSCLGESLANMELYIFAVAILQRYTVSLRDTDRARLDQVLLGTTGVIRSPGPHSIIFTRRN